MDHCAAQIEVHDAADGDAAVIEPALQVDKMNVHDVGLVRSKSLPYHVKDVVVGRRNVLAASGHSNIITVCVYVNSQRQAVAKRATD